MKFSLFVVTHKNPVPRLCDFHVVGENPLSFRLRSETMDFWIRKGTLNEIIDENRALCETDCICLTRL